MKKFLIQIFIFSLPIIICWLIIILIDPNNLYNVSRIIDDSTKIKIINRSPESQPHGILLWKTLKFKRKPNGNIIIGDSQSFGIKEDLISELIGIKIYNFSIPGANIDTKFSVFWFAARQVKLSHVIFQLSFPNWNMNEKNLFPIIQEYLDKPYLYLLNSSAFDDSFQNIKYKITNKYKQEKGAFEFPITDENKKMFDLLQEKMFKNYRYTDRHFGELKKIVSYCKENNVSLEFLFLPIHQRYYDNLSERNLIQVNEKFISDISSLGKTYNFSTNSNINNKEENFNDYFHQKQFITDSITRLVWGKNDIKQ